MKCSLLIAAAVQLAAISAHAQNVRVSPAPAASMPTRGTSVVVKVADYAYAREQVLTAASRVGADLLDGRTVVNPKGKKHGWLSFRMSAQRTPEMLRAAGDTGILHSESLDTTDHLSEYEELERRVQRLREHQRRLDGILKSSRRLRGSDILFVQERLFRAGADEDDLLQQRLDLERAARAGTMTVTLYEPGALPVPARPRINIGAWFNRGLASAWFALARVCARASTAAAFALVFAPIWIPALLLLIVALRRLLPVARRTWNQARELLARLLPGRGLAESTAPLS